METTTLAVAYEQHETVKKLGARWDQLAKRWVAPLPLPDDRFAPYLPSQSIGHITLSEKVYLLAGEQACWQCQQTMMVYALASTQLHDENCTKTRRGFFIFTDITHISQELEKKLHPQFCTYSYDYSTFLKKNVWLNHCLCSAKIDDVRLHHTRGAAFNPRDAAHCQSIKILPIPLEHPTALSGEYECKKRLQAYAKTQGVS